MNQNEFNKDSEAGLINEENEFKKQQSCKEKSTTKKKRRKYPFMETKCFVIYTGTDENVKDEYSLSEELFGTHIEGDFKVKVIKRGNTGNIIDQYIDFSRRADDLLKVKLKDRTENDIRELVKESIKDKPIIEFLKERIPDVKNNDSKNTSNI